MSDIDVWVINVNEIEPTFWEEGMGVLSMDECERHAQFSNERNAQTYAHTRILTRCILARKLGRQPSDLTFMRTELGRPSLVDEKDIDFNISHSGQYCVVALGRGTRVGVDIEYVRRRKREAAIVTKHFSEREQACYLGLSDDLQRTQYFFKIWTLKEAHSKARGVGFSEGFRRYDFDISDMQDITMQDECAADDYLWGGYHIFDVADGVYASLAILRSDKKSVPRIHLYSAPDFYSEIT